MTPEMIGEPFRRRINRSTRKGENRWFARYRCRCGGEFETATANVASGKTKSCGCIGRSAIGDRSRTHGKSGSRTYEIWCGMHKRCNDPTCGHYQRYGGRGIRVCDRWQEFAAFLADMGEAPAGMSLDRIDNDTGYEPGNCRWATLREQARNMRTSRRLTIRGVSKTVAEWAESSTASYKVVHRRLQRGWTPEEAVFGRGQ